MKRLLLSTAAVALLSGAAYAADLPVMEAPAPIVEATPVMQNWTGVYLGIHGGYGWGNAEGNGGHCRERGPNQQDQDGHECNDDGDFDDEFNFDDNADFEGGIVGGQIGANFQWNWFVLGVEADASAFFTEDDDVFDDDDDDDDDEDDNNNNGGNRNRNGNGNGGDRDFGAEAYWLSSVRGRVGIGLDRFLVYGTGGVGFGEFETEMEGGRGGNNNANRNNDNDDDDDGEVEVGWVAGGGAEFLITDNVSIGAEYLHYEFGDDDDDDDDDGGNRRTANDGGNRNNNDFGNGEFNGDVDVIRGRVNVKFGSLFGGGG